MQVIVVSRRVAGVSLRDWAGEQVRTSLRRLSWLVPRANVVLSEIDGTTGPTKRCLLRLNRVRGNPIVVQAVSHSYGESLGKAIARARRTLLQLWKRARATPGDSPRTRARGAGSSIRERLTLPLAAKAR